MEVVKLKGALKSYLWGGTNLKQKWNKESIEDTLSESWELSCHKDGPAVIDSGKDKGKLLLDVITKEDIGIIPSKFPFFPQLSKLIDSEKDLSIQVHPSDEYALSHENQYGKTEMWYILDAKPGAYLYIGLNKTLTKEEFSEAIENKTICNYLDKVYPKKGDTYFIKSGTLHAIGAGLTLFELQQNSSITYRVYDYDRRDKFGNLRDLHIEKAKEVTNLNKYDVPSPLRDNILGECEYFSLYRYSNDRVILNKESFTSITVVDGLFTLNDLELKKGDTAFIPASKKAVLKGKGEYLLTNVSDRFL